MFPHNRYFTERFTTVMKKLIYVIAIVMAAAVLTQAATRSKKADISRGVDVFSSVMKEVQTFYVDTFDAEKSVKTAIDAMLNQLDPYTEYFPRDDSEKFKSMTSLEYAGIGSYIMQRPTGVYISGPYKGSPAQLAGLRAGDLIMMIDGDTVTSFNHEAVSNRLKGTPGTTVRVTVKRPYVTDSIVTVDIVRRKINMPSVPYYGMVDGNVGYIQLQQFTERSADEVRQALEALAKNKPLNGVILDLRDNTGGYLEAAVKILGCFLPKGTEVLRTRGRGLLDEKVYKTTQRPLMPDMPMVVLIDAMTASSSEITAGALQDLDRAVVMGSRSFGKGLVQTTRSLPYDGMLKVTIAKYYIPSGRLIQAIDYSRRRDDGSVARIPDSLTHVFHTASGREVRDGGGITPDVEVKYPEVSRVTYNVVSDNWAFDYATRYAATHPSIALPGVFTITDSIYEDFKASIDPERFEYDKVCETILSRLREAAGVEGYMNDSLSAKLDEVAAMMKHPLDKDLDTHRAAIEPYLEKEIVSRYYYRPGEIISALRHDQAIDSAVRLLNTPAEYKALLTPSARK